MNKSGKRRTRTRSSDRAVARRETGFRPGIITITIETKIRLEDRGES